MNDRLMNVLFLCGRNSSLSIFGEAIMNRLGRGRFKGFSAGSDPGQEIDSLTLYQLERNNYDAQGLKVNDWREYAEDDAPSMDFIIRLSSAVPLEKQPDWPGTPMVTTWNLVDPASSDGDDLQRRSAYVRALTELESRISIFVNLPIDSLDRLKLQQRLDDIGQSVSPS
ncbi:MAG: arsenate reductase ArsC [Sedimenticolaceae bacterium]